VHTNPHTIHANTQVVEPLSKEWVPLLLAYTAAPGTVAHTSSSPTLISTTPSATLAGHKAQTQGTSTLMVASAQGGVVQEEAEEEEGGAVSVLSRVGTRNYHTQLLEWFTFLAGVKGARGLHRYFRVC